MRYYIDDENTSLNDLQKRIEETDLVPSRTSILENIEEKFKILQQGGIRTIAGLRKELKNSRHLDNLARETGIDAGYLTLLRREIEGYFPKPFALKEFDWLPETEIARLEDKGIRNTAGLYEAASEPRGKNELLQSTAISPEVLEQLVSLSDLTRIQWVSPKTAGMLREAGYTSASRLASAGAEDLCSALTRVNEGDRFFKGKIGLRDVKRLITAAGYVQG